MNMQSRKELYQQILENYLRANLPVDVSPNDVVLIQMNDVYTHQTLNGLWHHVLKPHARFECDIQKNATNEDIHNICEFFANIAPEIREIHGICGSDGIHKYSVMVIANVRGYRMTSDDISSVLDISSTLDERWQRCNKNTVFLISQSKTGRNT